MKSLLKIIAIFILEVEARLVLRKYRPKIVAITGNVGKTSTKDAVFEVLNRFFFVRKSQKSFNTSIGTPLAIIDCDSGWNNPLLWMKNFIEGLILIVLPNHFPDWLVLEVGADQPGDIRKVSKWLKPDIVVMTRIGEVPVHIEFFETREQLVREKRYLLESVKKDGVVLLNVDDADIVAMKEFVPPSVKVISFGFGEGASVRASNYHLTYEGNRPRGISFKIDYNGRSLPVNINNLIGKQSAYGILAAFAIGIVNDLNFIEVIESFEDYHPPKGRNNILSGINDSIIIDDTYNSSPAALTASLDILRDIKASGRKIALLGDMMELGQQTKTAHEEAGILVASITDLLFLIGQRARSIGVGAVGAGMRQENIFYFDSATEAGDAIASILRQGDVVLAKASQFIRMETAIARFLKDPSLAGDFLVRQEPQWLMKK